MRLGCVRAQNVSGFAEARREGKVTFGRGTNVEVSVFVPAALRCRHSLRWGAPGTFPAPVEPNFQWPERLPSMHAGCNAAAIIHANNAGAVRFVFF